MSLIRGILLAGQFRTHHELNGMSNDDQRNTLIVELTGRTNQPVAHFQAMDDATLAGTGAVLVFLRKGGIRTDAQLKSMSDDGQRNTLIVELASQTGLGRELQAFSNMELVLLGLGKPLAGGLASGSFIRGVLLAGQFRTQHELDKMSADDQRNTLIVELAGHSNQANLQALNDFDLAGAGAVMVFLRGARIRTDAQLKGMSVDDQRNTAIVEIDGQTHLGSRLQGLTSMNLVLTALGVDTRGFLPHLNAVCVFLDPPGSPTIGIRSYGLKGGSPRKSQLTWRVTTAAAALLPGGAVTSIISQAFAKWSAVAPNLSFTLLTQQTGGDIVIDAGNLGSPAPVTNSVVLGSTDPSGSTITFNSNAGVTFAPSLPGNPSLLAVATHEIGHALGLLHNTNPGSMMYPFNSVTEALAPDDIASIKALFGWSSQSRVNGIGTDQSPALCACGGTLVMAWRGIGDDDRIWVSSSTDGINWTPQHIVPGAASTDGPTLAWDGFTLWLALRGVPGDDGLYWATSSNFGNNWSAVSPIGGTGSSDGPTMTIFNGAPLLAWKGIPGDTGLFYTTWNNGWAAQKNIPGVGSRDRPSICVDFAGVPRMVWRGVEGDDALYTSTLLGAPPNVLFWQPQQRLGWVIAGNGPAGTVGIGNPGSGVGPSETGAPGKVLLTWQGVPGDHGIYFTQGAAGPGGIPSIEWSSQAVVPGIGTSARPSIASFGGRVHLAWKGVDDDHGIYTTSM